MDKQDFIYAEDLKERRIKGGISNVLFRLQDELSTLSIKDDLDRINEIREIRQGILDKLSIEELLITALTISKLEQRVAENYDDLFKGVLEKAKSEWGQKLNPVKS